MILALAEAVKNSKNAAVQIYKKQKKQGKTPVFLYN